MLLYILNTICLLTYSDLISQINILKQFSLLLGLISLLGKNLSLHSGANISQFADFVIKLTIVKVSQPCFINQKLIITFTFTHYSWNLRQELLNINMKFSIGKSVCLLVCDQTVKQGVYLPNIYPYSRGLQTVLTKAKQFEWEQKKSVSTYPILIPYNRGLQTVLAMAKQWEQKNGKQ